MADKATPVQTPTVAQTLYVVIDSFVASDEGIPVVYRAGEVVEADDPHFKLMPERFRAFEFPHPVKRRALRIPEVMS